MLNHNWIFLKELYIEFNTLNLPLHKMESVTHIIGRRESAIHSYNRVVKHSANTMKAYLILFMDGLGQNLQHLNFKPILTSCIPAGFWPDSIGSDDQNWVCIKINTVKSWR